MGVVQNQRRHLQVTVFVSCQTAVKLIAHAMSFVQTELSLFVSKKEMI
jgi:hypothetical protein